MIPIVAERLAKTPKYQGLARSEPESEYVTIARARLAEATRQGRLF